MILSAIVLHGFRSIINELEFKVRPTLTCLIGANEHGKTNLLDAAYLLDGGVFDPLDKNSGSKLPQAPQLDFSLELSAHESEELTELLIAAKEEFEEAAAQGEKSKKAAGIERAIAYLDEQTHPKIGYSLLSDSSRCLKLLGDDGKQYSWRMHPPAAEGHGSNSAPVTAARQVETWIRDMVPRALLFSPELELADFVTLEDLEKNSNPAFSGLLKLANAWETREELFRDDVVGHSALDRVGRAMTRKVRRIWSQGAEHTIRLDQSNGKLHLSIKDPTTFDKPSQRSLGFRSFFSFYLTLYSETQDVDPSGYVLLFDEPGIHLHPAGQKDLLREMRKLAKNNQIIYSTHSPFMIDRNDLGATYLIRKGKIAKSKGTHIVQKPYGSNWAALNDALGITPADGFFPAERALLVEGRSDRVYVTGYMTLCQTQTGADLNFFSVYDAPHEDADGVANTLIAADRHIVRLVDGDQAGEAVARRQRRGRPGRNDVRRSTTIIDMREFIEVKKPASIEDLLPFDLWIATLVKYARETLRYNGPIDPAEIKKRSITRSLGRASADYFVEIGAVKEVRAFSKASVAHLYFLNAVPVPTAGSPLLLLCERITRALGLAE